MTRLRIAAATLVLQFAYGLVYVWGVLAPYVRAEEHWPPLLLAAVWSATPVGWIAGIVVSGRVADRHWRRRQPRRFPTPPLVWSSPATRRDPFWVPCWGRSCRSL